MRVHAYCMQVVSSIKWNTNGSVLAVSGLFNVVDMFKVAGTVASPVAF